MVYWWFDGVKKKVISNVDIQQSEDPAVDNKTRESLQKSVQVTFIPSNHSAWNRRAVTRGHDILTTSI